MRDIPNYDCPKKFCPNKPGPMCGPCMADEIERLRAALRPFAAHFQFSVGYNNHDFQVASEAYGHVIADEQSGDSNVGK